MGEQRKPVESVEEPEKKCKETRDGKREIQGDCMK